MSVTAVIGLLVLLCGGTSVAAQGALPGDVLYPVKVSVNESVVAAFQVGAQARADYEAKLAACRLEEAAKLAAQGRMNAEARAELEARFQAFADRASVHIEEMRAKGNARAAAEVASRFEAALRAHDAILIRMGGTDAAVTAELASLDEKVNTALRAVAQARLDAEMDIMAKSNASAEAKTEAKTAAEGKVNATGNVIASVRKYLETRKTQLGASTTAEAAARLKVAEELVAQANAKISAEAYGEAFNLANQASRVAQESRVLVEAKSDLKVDVSINPGTVDVNLSGDARGSSDASTQGAAQGDTNIEVEAGAGTQSSGVKSDGKMELQIGL